MSDPTLSPGPPAGQPSPSAETLLRGYRVAAGHYDELLDQSGALRPHWAAFFAHAGDPGPADLAAAADQVRRQLHENGVTYNVHQSGARPWELDVLPHILPAGEWASLSGSMRQLARLLEAVAADLYGGQRLLRDGVLPPSLVLGHPGFIRGCHGVRPTPDVYLHLVAIDLGRGPDGRWRVMAVRAQAPSGAGYALENRLTVSRLFPDAFREQRVSRLASFFRTLQTSLTMGAPGADGSPHIVLLTPGPFTETYFEHAYLSRYLGFTLVEGADLTVRDDRVYLKAVSGLQPLHGILRRLDDTFCDPLELRSESTLGVPGLVQAWRAGHVMVANVFGMSVLESPALAAFLPAVCQHLFGEPLQAPLLEAVWPAGLARPADALAGLRERLIKPVFPGPLDDTVDGAKLDARGVEAWTARLLAAPDQYILEPYLPLSQAPVWKDGALEGRSLVMRIYLASDGRGDYRLLPGGLSRIGGTERQAVSGQRGGSSKDTWVLSDGPVERFSMLPGRLSLEDIRHRERMVSSRAAEHLFWMGRYAERSENCARLLRAVLSRLQDGDPLISLGEEVIVATCRRHGLLPPTPPETDAPGLSHGLQQALIRPLFDPDQGRSLTFNVMQTVRVAGTVRDRLSTDNWRVLTQLEQSLSSLPRQGMGLGVALDAIDRAILSLVAVGGLEMAHMTRDDGWRFMSLGRHLERLLYITSTVADARDSELYEDPALLDWLLDLSDSSITYRARYMGRAEWLAVADLLLFDGRNPRSAAFQLGKLAKHVPLLPDADLTALVADLERLAGPRHDDDRSGTLFPIDDAIAAFLASSATLAERLSDALTLRYFSHVYEATRSTVL